VDGAPTESAVSWPSKTIDSAKKRIWREVARLYSAYSNLLGGYRDAVMGSSPRPYINPLAGTDRKKDESHGLFVTAYTERTGKRNRQFLKGFHPKRILVVADELDVPWKMAGEALVDTLLTTYVQERMKRSLSGLGMIPLFSTLLGT
jgi:hypothetical protein